MSRGALRSGPAAIALLAMALVAGPASAQVVRPFAPRFSTNDRGDITLTGNTVMTCSGGGSCASAQAGTSGGLNNDGQNMQYVDVDGVPGTFCSSSAVLAIPRGATVLWAGLYWGGWSSSAARNQVIFTTPAVAGLAVTATQVDATGSAYQGFRDVTAQVIAAGSGSYMVANVQSTTGNDRFGGWSLVVAYRLASDPIRNIVALDGYAEVANGHSATIPVSGFVTPPAGAVNTRLGVVAYEGDLGFTGDAFSLNGVALSNAANPGNNFFNASVSLFATTFTSKNPNYLNQLGFDADLLALVNALPNAATSATLSLGTSGDRFYPGVVTFTTDLYEPVLSGDSFRKTVADLNGAPARPGDVLEYTITMTNSGNDNAIQTVLTDAIPTNATYVPGSIAIVTGANAGAKTDASADDQAEYQSAPRQVVARLGAGANATTGGALAPAASTSVRFRVTIYAPLATGSTVSNQAALGFTGAQTGVAFNTASDGDPTVFGSQPTVVTVAAPPSGVTIAGVVYADADHDLVRDTGEAGTGLTLYAKLVPAAAPTSAQAVVAAGPGTGAYAFTLVPAGTYSIVIDDNALASDVTPTIPAGWIVTEAAPGVRAGVAVAAADLSDQDVGLFNGSRISGIVFRDDGTGAGVANDGAPQGAEAAVVAARVRLTSAACAGGPCDSALTDGAGAFALWLPAATAGAVQVVETNPVAWLSTGATVGTTGGTYTRPTDAIAFTAGVGVVYTGLAFGDVPANQLVAAGAQAGPPGGVLFYPHTFTAGSAGTVTFSLTRAPSPSIPGWSADLFRDLDCDGTVDAGEPLLTAPVAATTGQTLCLVLRHTIPSGAPGGAQETVTIGAGFDYVNAAPALASSVVLGDVTTAIAGGGLQIVKSVDVTTARPGDTIQYTITYTNPGADPLTSIVIQDATPAFTVFDSASCGGLGNGLAGCGVTTAPASGGTGSVVWTLNGALAPGGSGTVTFRVRVQ